MYLTTITNEQKIQFTLQPKTAAGNPAQVDTTNNKPTWDVTEGDATLEVSEDGLSCTAISGEGNVVSRIKVTADADLGEGVQTIEDEITLTVVPAGASNLGIGAGEPTLK